MTTPRTSLALACLSLALASPLTFAAADQAHRVTDREAGTRAPSTNSAASRGASPGTQGRIRSARQAPAPAGTRLVVLPVEHVGSSVPGPQSPAAAREEARAALAEARTECRREPDAASRRDCLAQAREEHDRLIGRTRTWSQTSEGTSSMR